MKDNEMSETLTNIEYYYITETDEADMLNIYSIYDRMVYVRSRNKLESIGKYIAQFGNRELGRFNKRTKLAKSLIKIETPLYQVVLEEAKHLELNCTYSLYPHVCLRVYIKYETIFEFTDQNILVRTRTSGGYKQSNIIEYHNFTSLENII